MPKRLVLEVSYLKNEWDDSQALEFMPFMDKGQAIYEILNERLPREATAAKLFHLRKYGGEVFFRSLTHLHVDDQLPAEPRVISRAQTEKIEASAQEQFALHSEDLQDLVSVVRQYEAKNVKVALVLAPYLESYRMKVTNLPDWAAAINSSLQTAGLDAKLVDYSSMLASTAFSDHVHLNRDGQQQFTNHLLNLMSELKRGD